MRYIKMVLREAGLARVPNQLLSTDAAENGKRNAEDETTEDVNEFSSAGSIAGYSAPLGVNPDALGRKKNARRK